MRETTLLIDLLVNQLTHFQLALKLFKGECATIVDDFLFVIWSNGFHTLTEFADEDIIHLSNFDMSKHQQQKQ